MSSLGETALPPSIDRLYVINLEDRTDRRRDMVSELERIGWQADSPDVEFFAAIKPDSADTFPSIGARGCFLSHLGVLRDARRRELQTFLILEDDAAFTAECRAHLGAVLAGLDTADWAIAYLGHRIDPEDLPGPAAARGVHWRALPSETRVETTHAMLIHQCAAGPLIDYLERMMTRPAGHPEGGPMHVDGAYNWFRRDHPEFPTLVTPRQYVVQRASKSDIAPPSLKDRVPFIGIFRSLRNYLSRH